MNTKVCFVFHFIAAQSCRFFFILVQQNCLGSKQMEICFSMQKGTPARLLFVGTLVCGRVWKKTLVWCLKLSAKAQDFSLGHVAVIDVADAFPSLIEHGNVALTQISALVKWEHPTASRFLFWLSPVTLFIVLCTYRIKRQNILSFQVLLFLQKQQCRPVGFTAANTFMMTQSSILTVNALSKKTSIFIPGMDSFLLHLHIRGSSIFRALVSPTLPGYDWQAGPQIHTSGKHFPANITWSHNKMSSFVN